jgi:hypothetical protein
MGVPPGAYQRARQAGTHPAGLARPGQPQ